MSRCSRNQTCLVCLSAVYLFLPDRNTQSENHLHNWQPASRQFRLGSASVRHLRTEWLTTAPNISSAAGDGAMQKVRYASTMRNNKMRDLRRFRSSFLEHFARGEE